MCDPVSTTVSAGIGISKLKNPFKVKQPRAPRAPAKAPAAPQKTAQTLRPSIVRSRRKSGKDVLSQLRVPLQLSRPEVTA